MPKLDEQLSETDDTVQLLLTRGQALAVEEFLKSRGLSLQRTPFLEREDDLPTFITSITSDESNHRN